MRLVEGSALGVWERRGGGERERTRESERYIYIYIYRERERERERAPEDTQTESGDASLAASVCPGVRFAVQDAGLRVHGLGRRVQGFRFRV